MSDIVDLETRLLPCLIDMTWRGVRVDLDKAERLRDELLKREKAVLQSIKKLTGMDVEIWAAQSIAKAFEKLELSYPRTEKDAPSFTKSYLSDHEHELPKLIVEARNLNKTSGTFINTILKALSVRWADPLAHKPNPVRRWRHRLGPNLDEQPQSTANPRSRPRVGADDTRFVLARRRGPVGCDRLLATGTTDLGALRTCIWSEQKQPRSAEPKSL